MTGVSAGLPFVAGVLLVDIGAESRSDPAWKQCGAAVHAPRMREGTPRKILSAAGNPAKTRPSMSRSSQVPEPRSSEIVRVVVADDHPIVCSGLTFVLSRGAGFAVVGQARDGVEAYELIERLGA